MAKAITSPPSVERVAGTLEYALREWEKVPEYVRGWAVWNEDERLLFVLEWPKREEAARALKDWHDQGAIPDSRREDYRALTRAVLINRPLIDRLLADED